MKKFTLSILAVVMTAFVMTSCIDNAVSPEVKAIRAAQVNKINAQTALTTAQAAYQTALAAVQNAEAAAIAADTEWQNIQNDRALVDLQEEQAAAEVYLAQQELLLEQAIDALAEYIAEHNLTLAAEYLGNFQTASGEARDLAIDIADKVAEITLLQMYYSSDDDAYFATIQEWKERDLADAEAELAAANAALATIEAVVADPATAQATWADVTAEIQDYTNQILALEIDRFPTEEPLDDANAAKTSKSTALTTAKNKVNAINTILAELADAEADLAAAEVDAAAAVTAAEAESAELQAELDPFLDALVAAYETNAAYPGIVAGLEHDLRVAINMWLVATAQGNALVNNDPANDVSDAPGYDAAVSALEDAIDAIQTLTEVDENISVEDETTYPDFDEDYGYYQLTVNALVLPLAGGETYTMGGVTWTVNAAAIATATSIEVTGSGKLNVGTFNGTLTESPNTQAGDATITVTQVATEYVYNANDEDGVFTEDEIDAIYDQMVDINLQNPDPASAYAGASVLYNAVEPFFEDNTAYYLIEDIGRYDAEDFLDALTDSEEAAGDVAALDDYIYGTGGGDNGWSDVWDADDFVDVEADNVAEIEDGSSTDAVYDGEADDADRDEALQDAFDLIDGGSDDASDMQAAAVAAQTAAQTAYDAAKTAADAAQAAYDVFQDQIDDLGELQADAEDLLEVIENFIDGANGLIEDAKDRVEDAQEDADSAEKALADLDSDLEYIASEILAEQARLADLQIELAAKQDEAAGWLALLNAALGN